MIDLFIKTCVITLGIIVTFAIVGCIAGSLRRVLKRIMNWLWERGF